MAIFKCKMCGGQLDVSNNATIANCDYCGSEIDDSQPSTLINAVCPICKNASNNTVKDGKCLCSLCGTTFTPQAVQPTYNYNTQNVSAYTDARRKLLEEEKNKRMLWG